MARSKSGNGNGTPGGPPKPKNPDIAFLSLQLEATTAATAKGFSELRMDLTKALEKVVDRLDKVIENTGSHWRDLDARVRQLEQRAPRD